MFGSWKLADMPTLTTMPQKAASAFYGATENLVGGNFEPVLFAGEQLVNGVNYCFYCKFNPVVQNPSTSFVKVIINTDLEGKNAKVISVQPELN